MRRIRSGGEHDPEKVRNLERAWTLRMSEFRELATFDLPKKTPTK